MSDTIRALAHVQEKVQELRNTNVEFLSASRAETYDEYTKICGVLRGLDLADQIINDLVKRLERE